MFSHQKIHSVLNEIKSITGKNLILYNAKAKIMAQTTELGENIDRIVLEFIASSAQTRGYLHFMLHKIWMEREVEYVLLIENETREDAVIAQMAVSQIRMLISSMEEHYDRNNFIQNLLLGNLLIVDVYSKAKKLHIEAVPRVVYVIDTGNKNNDVAMELVKNLSNFKSGDFVTSVDEHSVVLVKDVSNIKAEKMDKALEELAVSLVDNLHMEAMVKVRVGYGNVVDQIPQIAESFQEAKMALQVGHIFYAENDTMSYGRLGIGRLIYQLPMSLCEMYIKEVFGEHVPEILSDEEAMSTITKFFENNLNISETARQLYVHRNTLVYRLERIEKAIGLDIRSFDDAMIFRIAVMVLAHMRESK